MRFRGDSAGRSLASRGGAFAFLLLLSACRAPGAPPAAEVGPLRAGTPAEAVAATLPPYAQAGVLAVHQVNVEQGDCTLIVGPDGTTVLMDAGNRSKGSAHVVPYLASIGIHPSDGLDFVIATYGPFAARGVQVLQSQQSATAQSSSERPSLSDGRVGPTDLAE